ncbi:MAG: Small subunit processome complex component [Watsoniomyces obsoletus]|nr:MAG: Small subunit processome complex component [Watsoniomyces obsoletus]
MKRILGTIKRSGSTTRENHAPPVANTPEGDAVAGVKRFCESGGPNSGGDDVLHLPGIVDAAESSPSAAREAALQIRKFLSKEYYSAPPIQYNAIMLVRILSDNPGPTFTRNLDARFATTFKELLRNTHDPGLMQLARETLDVLATDKEADEGCAPLREMWLREKEKMAKALSASNANRNAMNQILLPPTGPPADPNRGSQQNYFGRQQRAKALPPPHELVGRIEEAKTSAKLLLQVVQSTPPMEILGNDLIKEFANRCLSASRSIQGYINAEDPAPDNDTLLTLIDTNDQLMMAMSKHQRAVLQARKTLAARETNQGGPSPLGTATVAAHTGATSTPANSGVQQQQYQQEYQQQQQQQQQQHPSQLLVDPFRDDNQAPPPGVPTPINTRSDVPVSPAPTSPDLYGSGNDIVSPMTGTTQSYQSQSQSQPQGHIWEPFNPGYTPAQGNDTTGDDTRPYDQDGVNREYQQYTDSTTTGGYVPPADPAVNGNTEPVMRGGLR